MVGRRHNVSIESPALAIPRPLAAACRTATRASPARIRWRDVSCLRRRSFTRRARVFDASSGCAFARARGGCSWSGGGGRGGGGGGVAGGEFSLLRGRRLGPPP